GPIVQDVAPSGGYPGIRVARNLPARGPPGWAMFGTAALVMGYGYYKLGQGNIARREAKHEKRLARLALLPLLQAEEDVEALALAAERRRLEAAILRGPTAFTKAA
ncbi:unnamed protein product, partial [Discosporangium mesarthrocarpum]